MRKTNRDNPLWFAVGLALFTQLGLVQSAEATVGQIGYFEDRCPNGWKEYRKLAGRVIVGAGHHDNNTYKNGTFGGERTHQLTVQEMPAHTHRTRITGAYRCGEFRSTTSNIAGIEGQCWDKNNSGLLHTSSTGNNKPLNNMQPYLVLVACQKMLSDNNNNNKHETNKIGGPTKSEKQLKKKIRALTRIVLGMSKTVNYKIDSYDRGKLSDSESE